MGLGFRTSLLGFRVKGTWIPSVDIRRVSGSLYRVLWSFGMCLMVDGVSYKAAAMGTLFRVYELAAQVPL